MEAEKVLGLSSAMSAIGCRKAFELAVKLVSKGNHDSLIETLSTDQVTDQVEKLIEVIGEKTLSAKELMERLGIKHRPTFRDNYLNPAIQKGIIEILVKANQIAANKNIEKFSNFPCKYIT